MEQSLRSSQKYYMRRELGLCVKCGTNLNTGTCKCQKDDDELNPFAALRSMIVDNNEEV